MLSCFCAKAGGQKQTNRDIEKQLRLEKESQRRTVKVLLVGKKARSPLRLKSLIFVLTRYRRIWKIDNDETDACDVRCMLF